MIGGTRERYHARMQRSLALLLTILVGTAQADPPADRTERMVEVARVWASVKFFHPQLAYQDLDWDKALLVALPKVEAATTDAQYRAAFEQMLAQLRDPVTRTIDRKLPAPPSAARTDYLSTPSPGVLAIDLAAYTSGGFDYLGFIAKAKEVSTQAATAKVLVVDLRAPTAWLAARAVADFTDALPAFDSWPQQRLVEHHGYRTQAGQTSGGYDSTFVTIGTHSPHAPKTGPSHVLFVADSESALPEVALALQAAGRATIVVAGALREESIVTTDEIAVTGFKVQIRLGESLWGAPVADVTIAATADPKARALAIAKTLGTKPGKRRAPIALPPMIVRDDRDYPDPYPSRELRILAATKVWAILDRFNPYRYLAGDWDTAFRTALPKVIAAKDADEYIKALREFGVAAGDGHIGVASDPPAKRGAPAIVARVLESKLAVVRVLSPTDAVGIAIGDVIETIDGKRAADVMAEKRSITSGSTVEAREQRLAIAALGGAEGSTVKLGVRGANGVLREVSLARTAAHAMGTYSAAGGPAWKKLANNIGYVDLRVLTRAEVQLVMTELGSTKAIVFDMRGYPNGVAWSLAPLLNTKRAKHGAQFLRPLIRGDISAAMDQRTRFLQPIEASDAPYRGKVVVLIDDRAISQAEHTCLFLQEAAGATFVGSPTHGANGDITAIRLPGKLRMWFTGQEVRHVDGKQLQQVGIQPHVTIRPTLAGLRAGKDEVLDRAIAWIANGR